MCKKAKKQLKALHKLVAKVGKRHGAKYALERVGFSDRAMYKRVDDSDGDCEYVFKAWVVLGTGKVKLTVCGLADSDPLIQFPTPYLVDVRNNKRDVLRWIEKVLGL